MRGIDNISVWQVTKAELNEVNLWITYTLNGREVEKQIPLLLAVEIFKECKLHIATVLDYMVVLDEGEIEEVLLTMQDDDPDWLPIVKKIEELKKIPSWKKILRSL